MLSHGLRWHLILLVLDDLSQVIDGYLTFIPVLFKPLVHLEVDIVQIIGLSLVVRKQLVLRLNQLLNLHQAG